MARDSGQDLQNKKQVNSVVKMNSGLIFKHGVTNFGQSCKKMLY